MQFSARGADWYYMLLDVIPFGERHRQGGVSAKRILDAHDTKVTLYLRQLIQRRQKTEIDIFP